MKQHQPTVRLHIWLEEDGKTVFFGTGRQAIKAKHFTEALDARGHGKRTGLHPGPGNACGSRRRRLLAP
jgi:phosphoheptose isomerase